MDGDGASLYSLPEHMVGHLYSLLPDRSSRKAFYASSKSVCHAPSVLHQVTKLTVTDAQLQASEQDPSSNPLFTFPRKAKLRQLIIQYHEFNSRPDPQLMALLLPQPEDLRLRVQALLQDVELLHLKGHVINPMSSLSSWRLGEFLREHVPSLHTIRLPAENFPPAFFEALSAHGGGGSRRIQHLVMGEASRQHLEALKHFTNIRSLEFSDETEDGNLHQLQSAISKLQQLRHLCLKTITDLKADTVAALPASLESISFNLPFIHGGSGDCFDFFIELLSRASSGTMPALQNITINKSLVVLSEQDDGDAQNFSGEALATSLTQLSQCLSARATSIKIVVDCLKYDDEMEGACAAIHPAFWSVCSVLGSFATNAKFQECRISVADMAKLTEHCPHIEGIHFTSWSHLDNLSASLSAVVDGLPRLKELRLDFLPFKRGGLDFNENPMNYLFFLRGFGCEILSVSASLDPNRKHVLKFKVDMQTPKIEACIEAARCELHAMMTAWSAVCRRLELAGEACQQVLLEVTVNRYHSPL